MDVSMEVRNGDRLSAVTSNDMMIPSKGITYLSA